MLPKQQEIKVGNNETVILQSDIYSDIIQRALDDEGIDKNYFILLYMEYIRSLVMQDIVPEKLMQRTLANLLIYKRMIN